MVSTLRSDATSDSSLSRIIHKYQAIFPTICLCANHSQPRSSTPPTMALLRPFVLLSTLASLAFSLPQQSPFKEPKVPTSLPVVLWHGLGDTYDSKGMTRITEYINNTYPGTFIHSIYLNENPGEDRNAGFIGHLSDQVQRRGGRLADID